MRRRLPAILLVLLLAAVVKLPFEANLAADRTGNDLAGLNLKTREIIGQGLSLALLGGFRSLVADFMWIAGHTAWEDHRWFGMRQDFEIVTLLQPHEAMFWDMSSWHLAWNVSHAAANDPDEPREVFRLRNQRIWIQAGQEMLERGIANNPDNSYLYEKLAVLLRDKKNDLCGGADACLKAVQLCHDWRRGYLRRMAGYYLEQAAREKDPKRLPEAYRYWHDLWLQDYAKKDRKYWDSIDRRISERIKKLEDELSVPDVERLFPKPPTSDNLPS